MAAASPSIENVPSSFHPHRDKSARFPLSSPLTTFLWWSIFGLPIAGTAILFFRKGAGQVMALFQHHWRSYLWPAFTTGVMKLTTLLTFGKLQVGYSLAFFQLSTLKSGFLGNHYFKEGDIRRQLLGSLSWWLVPT